MIEQDLRLPPPQKSIMGKGNGNTRPQDEGISGAFKEWKEDQGVGLNKEEKGRRVD